MSRLPSWVALCILLATLGFLAGCAGGESQAPVEATPGTTPGAPGNGPGLAITAPADGAVLPAGDITVSVRVTSFRMVSEYGSYAPGEGHLHYYLDLPVAAPPGASLPGSFVPTTDTSFTWRRVPPGTHRFTVELASTDHTPLVPPVFRTVTVTVTGELPPTTVTTGGGGAGTRSCVTDGDCVPEQCCHPTSCINRAYKGVCNVACTAVCTGPLDCGAGHCSCVKGSCSVVPGPAAGTP